MIFKAYKLTNIYFASPVVTDGALLMGVHTVNKKIKKYTAYNHEVKKLKGGI